MTEQTMQMLPLSDVVPSPTNPRKTFDEAKTQELAASILEKGVLQPILVRPKGKKYELVCGERRFRASKIVQAAFKDRTTIPAVIRDLSDQEVREIQLIENFQREDVHPMEEAVAIKAALASGKYSMDDVAVKVGKSIKYIRTRVKLNDLSEDWQKVFFENRIKLADAIRVAAMSEKSQALLFEDRVDEDGGKILLREFDFDRFSGSLRKAPFQLDDAKLDAKAGACTTCQFNTSFNRLFPELEENAKCSKIECFNNKCTLIFNQRVAEALEDPTVILVATYSSRESQAVKDLEKKGHKVFVSGYGEDCEIIEKPELLSFDAFVDDYGLDLEDADEKAEAEQDYKKHVEEYDKDLDKYNKAISSPKAKKALVVAAYDMEDVGKYVYVEFKSKKAATSGSSSSAASTGTDAVDFDEEISKIKDRQKRAKQLDENKLWPQLKSLLDVEKSEAVKNEAQLSQAEIKGLALAICEKLDWQARDQFKKLFKIDTRKNVSVPDLTQETIMQMIRFFILSVLPPSMLYSGFDERATAFIEIARQYHGEAVQQLFAEMKEKADKRAKKADARIAQLKAQKAELTKAAKAKKPTPSKKAEK